MCKACNEAEICKHDMTWRAEIRLLKLWRRWRRSSLPRDRPDSSPAHWANWPTKLNSTLYAPSSFCRTVNETGLFSTLSDLGPIPLQKHQGADSLNKPQLNWILTLSLTDGADSWSIVARLNQSMPPSPQPQPDNLSGHSRPGRLGSRADLSSSVSVVCL